MTYPHYRIDTSAEVFPTEEAATHAASTGMPRREDLMIGVYIQRDEASTPEQIFVVIP